MKAEMSDFNMFSNSQLRAKNKEQRKEWDSTESEVKQYILDKLEKRPHCLCLYKLDHREKFNTGMKLDI